MEDSVNTHMDNSDVNTVQMEVVSSIRDVLTTWGLEHMIPTFEGIYIYLIEYITIVFNFDLDMAGTVVGKSLINRT